MYKEKIKYTDYNGAEREEEFFFNLNKAEIIEMEVGEAGGYGEMLKRIVESQDGAAIMKTFKTLILKSYGVKSPDGKRFMKSEEISKEFEQTEAYSTLFVSLCTSAEKATAFINGILPLSETERKELAKKAEAKVSELSSGD